MVLPNTELRGVSTLVTGGAGFIGSHLVDALVSAGARVRVLDNFTTGRLVNLEHQLDAIDLVRADLRDLASCRRACEGMALVFHQAALGSVPRSMKDPASTFEVNVAGTANLLTAARDSGVQRIVYASSSSVYGDSDERVKREGQEGRPLSPYALSKCMNEELAELFQRIFACDTIGLRYFNIYGPRQDPDGPYAAVIPRLFAAFRNRQRPTIHGDGEQTRDFTFVADAVRANLLAAGAGAEACGRAFNIGAGGSTSVNRLADVIRDLCGAAVEPIHGPPRPGDVAYSSADLTQASRWLGYQPSCKVEEGLRRTADQEPSSSRRSATNHPVRQKGTQ